MLVMMPALAFCGSAVGATLLGAFPGGSPEAIMLLPLGIAALLASWWLALPR